MNTESITDSVVERNFLSYAKRNIDLVMVTLNRGSETMQSITYKELTGKEPSFRENTEISIESN